MSTASISKSAIATALVLLAAAGCDSHDRTESTAAARAAAAGLDALHVKIDAARARKWMLHADGVDLYDARSNEKLRSIALPEWIWAGEFHSCPPGLLVGPGGDVFVSSNVIQTIWRIDAASFQVSRHDLELSAGEGREVGFSALSYSPQQGAFFAVNGLDGSLWRIDAALRRGEQVSLTQPLSQPISKGGQSCVTS